MEDKEESSKILKMSACAFCWVEMPLNTERESGIRGACEMSRQR